MSETDGNTAFAASLRALLLHTGNNDRQRIRLRAIASSTPERFFSAGLSLLRSEDNPDTRRGIYEGLVDQPGFLLQVASPDRLSRESALAVCRELMTIDAFFDVKLARLIPRHYEEDVAGDAPLIARVLDMLDEISSGSRLILLLMRLARHGNPQIASKAALLIARRVQNNQFVERHLTSRDARVRANVVEALWGMNTPFARQKMRAALDDSSARVKGNGLFGLYLLGDELVGDLLKRMLRDRRPPFRRTAAWVMGKIGRLEYQECLETALKDEEASVRESSRQALELIRQASVAGTAPGAGPQSRQATDPV